jgi:hypothetical protein
MNTNEKYQITDQEYSAAFYGFQDFLERQVGKEAVKAFDVITIANIFRESWQGKESQMDRHQKVAFTQVKNKLAKTTAWLGAQDALPVEEEATSKPAVLYFEFPDARILKLSVEPGGLKASVIAPTASGEFQAPTSLILGSTDQEGAIQEGSAA